MTKLALLAASLVACTSAADDPHTLVTCDPGWTIGGDATKPIASCEAACSAMPAADPSDAHEKCRLSGFTRGECRADHMVDADGVIGCCEERWGEPSTVEFVECE